MGPPANTIRPMRELQGLQFQALDRRAPSPAQAARGQQAGVHGQRVHHHGGRRPEQPPDFHVDPGEEFFYQLEGGITLATVQDGKRVDIAIGEGEIFLLPPNMPHSPRRPANTVGLVIERTRRPGELDGFQWYCENCGTQAVRGIHRNHQHRNAAAAGVRPLLRQRSRTAPAATAARSWNGRSNRDRRTQHRRTEDARRARSRREPGHRRRIRAAPGPRHFGAGAPSSTPFASRQFHRQRRDRRQRQLLDDHADSALPDDAHRERRAPDARIRRRLARGAARPAARRGS